MLQNKTTDEIHQELLNNISDDYDKTTGYLVSDLTKAVALEQEKIFTLINNIYNLTDVEQLHDEQLERFINQRKGLYRRNATFSTGVLNIKGNCNIKKGDLFETEAGTQFMSLEKKTIIEQGQIRIQSVETGSIVNVAANTITKMPISISGVDNVVNEAPTVGGYDAETDAELMKRYYIALRQPATSGNKFHYLTWATEIEGVGDAKVYPLERGTNTVEIVIIDNKKEPAQPDLIEKVQNHIDPGSQGIGEGTAPIGARCYVVSATGVELNINVDIQYMPGYDTSSVTLSIEENLKDYLKEIAFKQNFISIAKVGALLLDTEGVADYTNLVLNGQTGNVVIEDKQVLVLGNINVVQR